MDPKSKKLMQAQLLCGQLLLKFIKIHIEMIIYIAVFRHDKAAGWCQIYLGDLNIICYRWKE